MPPHCLLSAYGKIPLNVKHVIFLQADIDAEVLQDYWARVVKDLGIRGAAFAYRKDRVLLLSSIINAFQSRRARRFTAYAPRKI